MYDALFILIYLRFVYVFFAKPTQALVEKLSCPFKSGPINAIMRCENKREALTAFQIPAARKRKSPSGITHRSTALRKQVVRHLTVHTDDLCAMERSDARRLLAEPRQIQAATAANSARYRCCSRRDGVTSNRHPFRDLRACSRLCWSARRTRGDNKTPELRRTGGRASQTHVKQTR